MKTTRTMLTLVVTDVGERGGAVTIHAYLKDGRSAWFCALSLKDGMLHVRDLVARELWGKDQPKDGA
jgi:hypothetical protein